MADELVVVYNAGTEAEAYLLRNLLEGAGIDATVTDTGLEGVTGTASGGLEGVAQVVVKEQDAEEARRIALEFDQRTSESAERRQADSPEAGVAATAPGAWPQCPQCAALRATRCPVCGTAGTRFAQADPDYAGPAVVAQDAQPISSCGGCSDKCGPAEASPGAEAGDETGETEVEAGEPRPFMLLCPECDEPFVPEYARFCEQCGHEFAEGYEIEVGTSDAISTRAVVLIAGVILLLGALLGWFAFVL